MNAGTVVRGLRVAISIQNESNRLNDTEKSDNEDEVSFHVENRVHIKCAAAREHFTSTNHLRISDFFCSFHSSRWVCHHAE